MGGGSPTLKALVRICAFFENSMFLLDYRNEYLFGELNEKNSYIIGAGPEIFKREGGRSILATTVDRRKNF